MHAGKVSYSKIPQYNNQSVQANPYNGFKNLQGIASVPICFNANLKETDQIRQVLLSNNQQGLDVSKYTSTTATDVNVRSAQKQNPSYFFDNKAHLEANNKLNNVLREHLAFKNASVNLVVASRNYAENAAFLANSLKTTSHLEKAVKDAIPNYLVALNDAGFPQAKIFNCGEYAFWALLMIYKHNLLDSNYMAYIVKLADHTLFAGQEGSSADHDHVFVAIKKINNNKPEFIIDLWTSKLDCANHKVFIGTSQEYVQFLNENRDGIYVKHRTPIIDELTFQPL